MLECTIERAIKLGFYLDKAVGINDSEQKLPSYRRIMQLQQRVPQNCKGCNNKEQGT